MELWGGMDGNDSYDDGVDHSWTIAVGPVTADVVENFDHITTQAAITWGDGDTCQ